VAHVRLDRHDPRGSASNELGIDHLVGDVDVREQSSVSIALLGIELEADLLSRHELAVGLDGFPGARRSGRRPPRALLRGDPDVANGLGALAQVHEDRAAVDDIDHLTHEHLRSARALRRVRPGGPQLLARQGDLLIRQQQTAGERVHHRLDVAARDFVDAAILRARQRERPALAVAGEIDRGIHGRSRPADADVAVLGVATERHAWSRC